MRIYIASLYSRRAEMSEHKRAVEAAGHEVTAQWIDGAEEGMDMAAAAKMDVADVVRADCVLSFTHPHGTLFKGGGRHTEFGLGMALGKLLVIVGEREQIFHWHPDVRQHDTLESALTYLGELDAAYENAEGHIALDVGGGP